MLGIAEQLGVIGNWKKKPELPAAPRHVNKGQRTKQVSDYMFEMKVERTTVEVAKDLNTTQDKVSHALRRCVGLGEVKKLREQKHGGTVVAVWITTRTE